MKIISDIYDKDTTSQYYTVQKKDIDLDELNDPDKLLYSLIPDSLKDKTILDLGGGNCRYAEILCKKDAKKVLSLDLSTAMIEEGKIRKIERELSQLELVCDDMDTFLFEENSIDIIFSRFSLMYSSTMAKLVQKLGRALVPGGEILVETNFTKVPNNKDIHSTPVPLILSLGNKTVHIKNFPYTLKNYKDAFKKAGLKISVEQHFPADDLSVDPNFPYQNMIQFTYAIFKLTK